MAQCRGEERKIQDGGAEKDEKCLQSSNLAARVHLSPCQQYLRKKRGWRSFEALKHSGDANRLLQGRHEIQEPYIKQATLRLL